MKSKEQKEPNSTTMPSPGERLKDVRIEYGLTLEEVAEALFLSTEQVDALENNRHESLPGWTYVIGYWRNYAGLFNINISEEIETYRNSLQVPAANIALHLNHRKAHGHQEKSRKRSAFLFFILSVAFLSGIWYWQNPTDNPTLRWIENQTGVVLNGNNNEAGNVNNSSILPALENAYVNQQQSMVSLPEPNFTEGQVGVETNPAAASTEAEGTDNQVESDDDTEVPSAAVSESDSVEEQIAGETNPIAASVNTADTINTGGAENLIEPGDDTEASPAALSEPDSAEDRIIEEVNPIVTSVDTADTEGTDNQIESGDDTEVPPAALPESDPVEDRIIEEASPIVTSVDTADTEDTDNQVESGDDTEVSPAALSESDSAEEQIAGESNPIVASVDTADIEGTADTEGTDNQIEPGDDTEQIDEPNFESAFESASEPAEEAVETPEIVGPYPRYNESSLNWIMLDIHKTAWIDVRNGSGEKLVFRTVREGEHLEINGSPPFYVFIGALDGVDVFYLGDSVEVTPYNSESSRFVVGEYPQATVDQGQ